MSFAVCPKCGRRYTLKENMAGKAVKCGKCGQAFQAPPAAAEPIASPVVRSNISDLLDELPLEAPPPPPPVEVEPAASRGTTAARSEPEPAAFRRAAAPAPPERKVLGTTDKQWLSGATTLLVIGIGSQILPHFGLQFVKLADMPPTVLPLGGLLFTLGGCGCLLVAWWRKLKVALSAVGGVLAVFAIAYGLSPGSPKAVADLRAAADQVLDGFNRVEMVLSRVHDAGSLQAALPPLREAIDRMDAGTRRVNELESKGVRLTDQQHYLQQLDAAVQRLKGHAERIAAIPGSEALRSEMLRMAHLGEGPAPAPPFTPGPPTPRAPDAVAKTPSASPSPAPSPFPGPTPRPDPKAVADLKAAADQVLDGFNRVEMALGRIHDAGSLQAALPPLREAIDRMDAGTRRVNELESKGVRLTDQQHYLQQLEAAGQRLKGHVERIAAIPGSEALRPEILRMAHLGEGPAPAPSPFPGPTLRPDLPPFKPPPPELVLPKPQPPRRETFAGHRSGKSFESKAPKSGLLIGVQVFHWQIGPHVEVKAIQPLYLVDGRPVPDARFGGGGQSRTVAKPGYAVGGMRANVGVVIHGVQLVYMRIKGKRLDPKDSYDSEWLGSNQRGGERTVIGKGQPVVGIFGSHGTLLNGLGFLVAKGPASKRAPSAAGGERSSIVGATRETSFEDAAPEGGLLVGVQAVHGDFAGIPVLESVQPIYLVGEEQVRGKRCGYDPGSSRSIAKEGYAVGAIKVRTGMGVAGLQLVYMRISGDRLDPQDAYESEVLGGSEGGGPIVLDGDGRPLAGLQGTYQGALNGIGLLDTAP
jgi:predicted Zn finger-like uncharacterized protein